MKGGQHNSIHVQLKRALRENCLRNDGTAVITHEPQLLHHAERVLGAATSKTRADIGITLPCGSATLLDTSISKPTATVIEKAGSSADNRVFTS